MEPLRSWRPLFTTKLHPLQHLLPEGGKGIAEADDGSSGERITPVNTRFTRGEAVPLVERRWRRRVFCMCRG
ncbi:MAG: hypothetical protein HGA55_03565 [Methanoregulaceae archaeon]|nr:hypothetical protein [Methanoregulaceae archaeon]